MKKQKQIWVIVKRPEEKRGHAERIQNELHVLQEIVGGSIETLTVAEDMVIICNANGLEEGLPYNCEVEGVPILGTLIVAGVRGEEFANTPVSVPKWENQWMTHSAQG